MFFFGAEFTHVYAQHIGTEVQPREHAVRKGDKPDARLPTLEELPSKQARPVFEEPLT